MFGWVHRPFRSNSEITANLEIYPKNDGSMACVLSKRLLGLWSTRLAELSLQNELQLYKSATDIKKYDLNGMKKLLLGAGKNSIHARMTLRNGEKLYLKLGGQDRAEWGKRISECKFPKKPVKEPKKEEDDPGQTTVETEDETFWEPPELQECMMKRPLTNIQPDESVSIDSYGGISGRTYSIHSSIPEFRLSGSLESAEEVVEEPVSPSSIPLSTDSFLRTAIGEEISEEETDLNKTLPRPVPPPRLSCPAVVPFVLDLPSSLDKSESEDSVGELTLVSRMGRVFEKNFLSRKDSLRFAAPR